MEGYSFPRINSPIPINGWVAIILSAGKGKRMKSDKNKVCHTVGGIPVINRIIATLRNWGFQHILVVVGHKYQEVINCVEEQFPDVNFVLQEPQKGTGHAVRCACEFLRACGFRGNLLIIAGDKIVNGKSIKEMRESFQAGDYDLLIATSFCQGKSFGRVIRDEQGKIKAIMETKGREEDFPTWGETNQSLYMLKMEPLYEDIKKIGLDEHSCEEQFTDIVAVFYSNGRKMGTYNVEAHNILTFNTPEELREIEGKVGRVHFISEVKPLLSEDNLKRARDWLCLFNAKAPTLLKSLKEIYVREDLIFEKIQSFCNLLREFVHRFGENEYVFLVRSPGKLNILGRHIDHRGGRVNSIAVDREILMVVAPRKDDRVEIFNTDDNFQPRSFSIAEEMNRFRWGEWEEIYMREDVDERGKLRGDWVLYAKASALRFQERFRDIKMRGFKALVWGDIPTGSGLSSSSSLVVAFAEALCLVNGLVLSPQEFVHLCGEGEWFVGTRGGMGDHAGIKMGQPHCVNQFSFHPFQYIASAPLPKGFVFLFAYSYEEAKKASNAKEIFNQRVACYEIGTCLLKKLVPEISYLRDIHPEVMGIEEEEIFLLLKKLPITMSRQEVISELGEEGEGILKKHNCQSQEFPIRGVCLFGVAECARSRMCLKLLEAGDVNTLGELINISHNGDRVTKINDNGQRVPYSNDVSDSYLDYLIESRKNNPHRKEFSLPYQPGDYACSSPSIDHMVDIVLKEEGVLGAQILGAGLGGSIMVFAREEAIGDIKRALEKGYYEPRGLEPRMGVCIPIKGASCIEVSNR